MKNFLLILICLAAYGSAGAQSIPTSQMKKYVELLETKPSNETLDSLTIKFNDIAKQNKTQWLPYYYAAFAQIRIGRNLMMTGRTSDLDSYAEKAQNYLDEATTRSSDNAELALLQKMIHGLRLLVNPMERYVTEMALGEEALDRAAKLDPANPRITLLRAEDLYFTPEAFGGSKSKALELFTLAVNQFKSYPKKGELHPSWGLSEANYFIQNQP